MRHEKTLVRVGAAVAALLLQVSDAVEVSAQPQQDKPVNASIVKASASMGPIIQRLMYQAEEQAYDLILHKSSSGVVFVGHGSHRSHGSHVSHRSHRSGR